MPTPGKDNPFNPDGKSGAMGNAAGGKFDGMKEHRGVDRSQSMGDSLKGQYDGDRPSEGDKHLKVDPPASRVKPGLVSQTAEGGMRNKPYKLGGKGPSMPAENADESDAGPVGDVRNEPSADSDY